MRIVLETGEGIQPGFRTDPIKRADTQRVVIKHTHRASTVAMFLTVPEVCEVSMRQGTKRLINAFPLYAVPTPSALMKEGIGEGTWQRYGKI